MILEQGANTPALLNGTWGGWWGAQGEVPYFSIVQQKKTTWSSRVFAKTGNSLAGVIQVLQMSSMLNAACTIDFVWPPQHLLLFQLKLLAHNPANNCGIRTSATWPEQPSSFNRQKSRRRKQDLPQCWASSGCPHTWCAPAALWTALSS